MILDLGGALLLVLFQLVVSRVWWLIGYGDGVKEFRRTVVEARGEASRISELLIRRWPGFFGLFRDTPKEP